MPLIAKKLCFVTVFIRFHSRKIGGKIEFLDKESKGENEVTSFFNSHHAWVRGIGAALLDLDKNQNLDLKRSLILNNLKEKRVSLPQKLVQYTRCRKASILLIKNAPRLDSQPNPIF